MMQALEAGAADFVADEGVFEVYTGVEEFDEVREAIKAEGLPVVSAELAMVPSTYVELTAEDDIKNMKKMLEAMEANDDIQDVWHNWDEE
jgi:transcriptional/translational regulatory protein YebC/TACO1